MTKYYKVVRHFLKYLVSTKYNRELIARKGKEKYKQREYASRNMVSHDCEHNWIEK